ncbi:MAG: YdbH domain-containing protein [Opitutaceae bacterium]|nr:YdbH domain-containing protein [Opitutaceae bacterium]
MRTRRKRLRLLGLLGLLIVALGAAAAAGWLPPLNDWVERRLLAELSVLGVETSATQLRELSWRRAVVGPVELQLPGLTVRADEARAELGWRVLAGRAAPAVVLRGLVLDLTLERWAELRGALQSQSGGFPYGRLDVEESRVVLRQGERRLELPFSGFIDSRVEEWRAEVVVMAPALAGRMKVRTDLGEDSVELELREGRVAPTPWRELLAGLAPPSLLALDTTPEGVIQISGTTVFASGRLRQARMEASLPALLWRPEGQQADLGAVSLQLGAGADGRWRLEARTEALAWQREEMAAGLTDLDFVMEPGSAQMSFAGGRAVVAGTEVKLHGRCEAHWGETIKAAQVEAQLKLEPTAHTGWRLAEPCELAARWNGAELMLTVPALELDLPTRVQVGALEATVVGLLSEHPAMTARARVATTPLQGSTGAGLVVTPAQVVAQVSLSAGLTHGQEGARLEWTVPQQRRDFVWEGGRAEAAIGGEGLLNLDRSYVSGRATVEVRTFSASGADWYAAAQTGSFGVRWPRVWLDSLRRWSGLPVGRLARELAWAGDYEVKVTEGQARQGRAVRVEGVELRATSRGAELFETGGADVALSVADAAFGGLRLSKGKLQAGFGLDGGAVQGGFALPGLELNPAFTQTLHWNDGLVAEGTFGFESTVLGGEGAWGDWLPALAGCKLTGGIGLQGRSRYAGGEWMAGADLALQDFGVAWPAQKVAVEQINGTLALADLGALRSAPEQRLKIGRADLAGVELTNTEVAYALDGPGRVAIAKLEAEAFGGRVAAAGFEFDPRQPSLSTKLEVKRARMEQLLRLFDDVPAEAEGPVDGELAVSWRDGQLQLGTGFFGLTNGELGRVRFTRDLHLLTSGRSPNSIGYASLLELERSIQNLNFNRLRIDTYPKDAPGQSLRLRLVGTPVGGTMGTPVNLDVNVNAPLEHFLNWGRPHGAAAP